MVPIDLLDVGLPLIFKKKKQTKKNPKHSICELQ